MASKKKPSLRTTGLPGLDAQFGGGTPPGRVHLLLAAPMNAQELFAYHFAAGGTHLPGGTIFVATEVDAETVIDAVGAFGGDVDHLEVTVLEEDGEWELPVPEPGVRYVMDSFSTLVQGAGWDDAFEELMVLRREIRAGGGDLLACAIEELHAGVQAARLRHWADGVLEMGFDRQGFGLYPYLKVTKMRGLYGASRLLLFKETEKGLFMESTKRVF